MGSEGSRCRPRGKPGCGAVTAKLALQGALGRRGPSEISRSKVTLPPSLGCSQGRGPTLGKVTAFRRGSSWSGLARQQHSSSWDGVPEFPSGQGSTWASVGREPQCLPRRHPENVPCVREEGLGQNPEAQQGSRGSGGRAMSDGDGGRAQSGGNNRRSVL